MCSSLTSLWSCKYVFQIHVFFPAEHKSIGSWCVFVCVRLCVQCASVWVVCSPVCMTACVFHQTPGMFSHMKSLPHATELWCFHQALQWTDRPLTGCLQLALVLHGTTVSCNSLHSVIHGWVSGPVLSPDIHNIQSLWALCMQLPRNIFTQLFW